jgi:hypothetical protein
MISSTHDLDFVVSTDNNLVTIYVGGPDRLHINSAIAARNQS